MTISEKVFDALTAGSPAPLRVNPDALPQYAVFPFVTYTIVGGEDDIHLNGSGGIARRLVQVDAWGYTRMGVEQTMVIAKSLMLAAPNFTVGRVDVSGASTFEPGAGPGTDMYRASLEFSIHYET